MRQYAVFALIVIVCAIGSFTQTSMNPMLGAVGDEFGIGAATSQWLTSIFMLTIGIAVPLVVHLARKLSVRTLMLWSLSLFLAGSLIGYFAPSFGILVIGRILQATGTGFTLPIMQTMAMTRFPGRVGTAMGIAGIAMGFAPNIGPLIGGAMVEYAGWRSFFLLLCVMLAALLVAAIPILSKEKAPEGQAHLDMPSFMLSTLAFGALLVGFTDAANLPPYDALVWLPILLGAAALVLFVVRQKRISEPLISMGIFDSANYRVSFIVQNVLFASFMGITLIIPLFVENISGLSPVDAGIVFVPATILAIVVNPLSGILFDKLGVRPVVLVGSLFLFVGSASFLFVDASTSLLALMVMQTVRGIGVSTLIGPFNSWGMVQLPFKIAVDGSAFFTTVRQACAALGVALMMVSVSLIGGLQGYIVAFGISAALALAVLAICAIKVR